MEKLELKHLAPYLPYDLECKVWKPAHIHNNKVVKLVGLINKDCGCFTQNNYYYDEFKPILRPLSDLTKVIQHNGDEFIPYIEYNYISEFLEELSTLDYTYMDHVQYKVINVLFELHFDVFGLIEKGLAIDINTIKS